MRRRLLFAGVLAGGLTIALAVILLVLVGGGESEVTRDEPATATLATPPESSEPGEGTSVASEQRTPSSQGKTYDAACIQSIRRDYDCYEAYLVDILNTEGAPAALIALADLVDTDEFARAECHPLTHSIGRAAMTEYGSYQNAVVYEDGTCWSGFTHGILEGVIFQYKVTELDQAVQGVCVPDPAQPYSFDYYNCVHGLGHGVSWRFDNGVFEALPICDTLEGTWEQQSCYSGIFMQNIIVDGALHQSRELRPDEPMYPCTAVDDKYKDTCYLMQTSYALNTVNWDFAKGFELCETEADEGYVETCYASMGRDINNTVRRDPRQAIQACSLGDPELQTHCFQGAVKDSVFNDHGLDNANEFCELVPARYQQDCTAARDEALSSL